MKDVTAIHEQKYVFKYDSRNSCVDETHSDVLDVKFKYIVKDNEQRQMIVH